MSGFRGLLIATALVAGCKAKTQPVPPPPRPPVSVGWNASVRDPDAEDPPPTTPDEERFRRACERVIALMGEDPTDVDLILEECIEAAQHDWEEDPEQFDAQAECFLQSETMSEAETCISNAAANDEPEW